MGGRASVAVVIVLAAVVAAGTLLLGSLQGGGPGSRAATATPAGCGVSGLRAWALADNDTVIVEFNASCRAAADVYLDGAYLGSFEARPGLNRHAFKAPFDVREGWNYTVKLVIGGYTCTAEAKAPAEELTILPSHIDAGNKTLVLRVTNKGDAPAVIVGITVLTPEAEVTVQSTRPPYPIVVEPGQQKTITADLSNASITLEPGTAYTVKVTTQAGNTYVAVVFCK